jgi:hypothetical protein
MSTFRTCRPLLEVACEKVKGPTVALNFSQLLPRPLVLWLCWRLMGFVATRTDNADFRGLGL